MRRKEQLTRETGIADYPPWLSTEIKITSYNLEFRCGNKAPIVHNSDCHPRPPEYVLHKANAVAWSGTFIWSHRHAWKLLLTVMYYHLFTEGKSNPKKVWQVIYSSIDSEAQERRYSISSHTQANRPQIIGTECTSSRPSLKTGRIERTGSACL